MDDNQATTAGAAARISLLDIEQAIAGVVFATGDQVAAATGTAPVPGSEVTTICLVTMRNGFTIVGKSACADPRIFDAEIGRKVAYDDVIDQAWPLLGYSLRDRLAAQAA